MYKLILHHVYRSSAPFLDLSGHGTHAQGTNVGWSADGAVPQSGAAVFNGSNSRALVPISPVWQDLYSLRVDALVRFDPETEKFDVLKHPRPEANVRQILGRTGEVWAPESGTDTLVRVRTE